MYLIWYRSVVSKTATKKDPMVTDLFCPSQKQTKHTQKNTPWFLICCIQVRNKKMYLTGSIFCIHIRNERCTSLVISDVSTSETNCTSLVPDLWYSSQKQNKNILHWYLICCTHVCVKKLNSWSNRKSTKLNSDRMQAAKPH